MAATVSEPLLRKVADADHGSEVGRKGLPDEWVFQMYADYWRLRSLAGVAKLYGRTRQNMWDIFKRRGLKMFPRVPIEHPPVLYGGRKWTPGKEGYLRDTLLRDSKPADREGLLHRQVWRDAHGPIPEGYQVGFADGNCQNWALDNLFMAPHGEMSRLHSTGRNQWSKFSDEDRDGKTNLERAWEEFRKTIAPAKTLDDFYFPLQREDAA